MTSAWTETKQRARAAREAALASTILALPDKQYGVLLADPGWRFEPFSRETGVDRAADNHYVTEPATETSLRSRPGIAKRASLPVAPSRSRAGMARAGARMPEGRGSLLGPWRRLAAETAWNIENERLQRAIENNNARYQRALADVGRAFDEMMKDAADKEQLALAEVQKAYRGMGMETADEQ